VFHHINPNAQKIRETVGTECAVKGRDNCEKMSEGMVKLFDLFARGKISLEQMKE
jgi:hypothetical protein